MICLNCYYVNTQKQNLFVTPILMKTRYKAFLSYSHSDSEFATWLHRRLENWAVPRDLVGRQTPSGTVPRRLRPVFRDRDDFAGGASLKTATLSALEDSEFLVVLCSPHSANSLYVNEEVRLFKAMGRADRIIPVIIAGDPGDHNNECFPDAVKYIINDTGQITDELAEPLAADAREQGDGRHRATAKVVAGLLGLSFDEIIRRAEQARRKRNAMFAGVGTGAFLFATAFAAYALIKSHQANLAIERSVFAIGGLIQVTDQLNETDDLSAIQESILVTQCDLIEGLARNPSIIGPLERTICLTHQADKAIERGDKDAAVQIFDEWFNRLRRRFEESEKPHHDLATAMVRAALERYRLHLLTERGNKVDDLNTLANVAYNALQSHLELSFVHDIHEQTVWELIDYFETKEDYPLALELTLRTALLRQQQATMEIDSTWRTATYQTGVHFRRAAWLSLHHLNQPLAAIEHAGHAATAFENNPAYKLDPADFFYQFALAYQVRADALVYVGQNNQALVDYDKANQQLFKAKNYSNKNNKESTLPEIIKQELDYIEKQLQDIGS